MKSRPSADPPGSDFASAMLRIGLIVGMSVVAVDALGASDATFTDANWMSTGNPGANGPVYAVAADGSGNLYIGGDFSIVGESTAANRIAKWDGNSWSALGSSSGMNNTVQALVVSGGDLYAGGLFTTAGGTAANYIAKWNGHEWTGLGSGTGGGVYALAMSGNELYAGGGFNAAGGNPAGNIAKWDGQVWSSLGVGVNGGVLAVAVAGGDVYVGGSFMMAGGSAANSIAKWDGNTWSPLASGIGSVFNPTVRALLVSRGDLYAGGFFRTAGGVAATNIAKWDGANWAALGSGVNGNYYYSWNEKVNALAMSGGDIYVGGVFTNAGGIPATNVAKWNGSSWSALSSGVDWYFDPYIYREVTAMTVLGAAVYAGGTFTSAGGSAANRIARWNGNGWSAVGPPNDSGFNGKNAGVYSLTVSGSNLFAAGQFTKSGNTPVEYVAKWNGSGWSAIAPSPFLSGGLPGSGGGGFVSSLVVSENNVYVAGKEDFGIEVGFSPEFKIWDGSGWLRLGVHGSLSGAYGVYGSVYALAVSGSSIYGGGCFVGVGGDWFTRVGAIEATNIFRLDGTNWSAVGSGVNGDVNALVVSRSDLYAGGAFTMAGGNSAIGMAKWDGTNWSALGSGINNTVLALAVSSSDLYAGGQFTTAGGIAATNIAKWDGTNWTALGCGLLGTVRALAVSGTDLYAGGDFTTAGGEAANFIAKWDGTNWTPLGSGMNSTVQALAVFGEELFAGGSFTVAGGKVSQYIARAYLPALPPLYVFPSDQDVIVTWRTDEGKGFILEDTKLINAPMSWMPTPNVGDDGLTKWVVFPSTNAPQYFRLRRP